ncbi:hypothetical protein J6590_029886 [Homalodisca vitripennis]|nr:hypothetical protein J6590_029886 [Homalodisca vitripennis]
MLTADAEAAVTWECDIVTRDDAKQPWSHFPPWLISQRVNQLVSPPALNCQQSIRVSAPESPAGHSDCMIGLRVNILSDDLSMLQPVLGPGKADSISLTSISSKVSRVDFKSSRRPRFNAEC